MSNICRVIRRTSCLNSFWFEIQMLIYHNDESLFAEILMKITLLGLRNYVQENAACDFLCYGKNDENC